MNKTVKHLIPAENINMGGIILKQALPTHKVDQVDPFLLLHHADFKFRDEAPAIKQGIGPHPHRGFSPVTFVIKGEVHHRDSRGNDQIAKQGEVQWMHAGAGIVHSERPSQNMVDQNGKQEIIQLWINTPSDKKMSSPHYQYLSEKEMSTFYTSENKFENKLIAGRYNDLESSIKTQSELLIIWTNATSKGKANYKIERSMNTMLYLISGEINITSYGKVEKKNLIIFENDSDEIEIRVDSNAQFLLLAGKAINEKVVQQGPFVMNTETQILEAMRDYQMGKMGILIEDQ